MDKHLIVVSVDAMFYEDLAFLHELPNMGRLLREGSLVKRMTTIYPSLTHPVHATLMSGNPAGKTGIHHNQVFTPGKLDAPWYNQLSQMKCETIFHAAHRAGLTTCACRWPLTAGGFDVIDWLIPEVMDSEIAEEPDLENLYRRVCTPELFDCIVKPNLHIHGSEKKFPNYDVFSMTCAAEIIRKYKPNLLFSHPGIVDHYRHLSGLFSPSVEDALRMTDDWIGMLMQAAEDAGIVENTNICIVSDHGQLEYTHVVALNAWFAEKGLLQVNEDGTLADWDIYCEGGGLSAQVYVKDKSRETEFLAMLEETGRLGIFGFEEVLTVHEAGSRYGLAGDFSFVLESDGCTVFSSDWKMPIVRTNKRTEFGEHFASHGHMPEKGYQPTMVACGPAFKKGVCIETGTVLDEAPTFAAVLGLMLPQAQGAVIAELLR